MPKRKLDVMSGVLFDDLNVLLHAETVEVQPGDLLEKILEDVCVSRVCGVCKNNWPLVFGEGNAGAKVMVIGEGPGVDWSLKRMLGGGMVAAAGGGGGLAR